MTIKISLICIAIATTLLAKLGDLNNDSKITLDDCKQIAAAVAAGTDVDKSAADIDGDGAVTIVDAMRLHQSIGGLWVEPTGKIAPVPQISSEERAYFSQYEEFCDQYNKMSPGEFLSDFKPTLPYKPGLDPAKSRYFSVIDTAFDLTDAQKAVLKEKGMVVLNKTIQPGQGFGRVYFEIFKKDLPVFFTSDALLDPLYKMYNEAFKAVETYILMPDLLTVLSKTLEQLQMLKINHSSDSLWLQSIDDATTYLSVAKCLIEGKVVSAENSSVTQFLNLISSENLTTIDFFGTKSLTIDFSQFKPRGHYEERPLSYYFKSMMWLGRADCGFNIDSIRQLRGFLLIQSCMDKAGVLDKLANINKTISFFVGDVDGFSIEGLSEFLSKNLISLDSVITSNQAAQSLKTSIKRTGCGMQLILSQAMWKEPDAERPELPAIAQICGQRFILDSYLLGRTVEWYVKERNVPFLEEVPFCLGNTAATDVIAADVNKFTFSSTDGTYKPYHTRLGATRVLFDKYPFWDRNLYTLWLDGLRSLSQTLPETAPAIMRSHSWQDKQMNTQLASWAQLRHNTLLYAKQSYTGSIACFYPDGYVEPYPEFYRNIREIVNRLKTYSAAIQKETQIDFQTWEMVADSLASIAELELAGKDLTKTHIEFLNQMLSKSTKKVGCGSIEYDGWYVKLFSSTENFQNSQPCIADVHTIPPGAVAPSDIVLHAATGDASLIIIQASTNDSCGTLYCGAVSSFYQHDESPMKRLADSEWISFLKGANKPGIPGWFGQYVK